MNQFIRRLVLRSPTIHLALSQLAASSRFHVIRSSDLARTSAKLTHAWQDETIPSRQRDAINHDLAEYRDGKPNATFDALVEILVHNIPELERKSLLEVGCSSGYYSEVLRSRGVKADYRGCDYSLPFVQLARQTYKSLAFDVEDATSLSYESEAFDVVISGCCLLHIPQYGNAVAEASRVSKEFVAFHRTPVLHLAGPSFYTKTAYRTEMLEIHFNEQELTRLFTRHGLQIVDINTHLATVEPGRREPLFYKTYLCRKVNR
jgi:2-polyprenyl-3-methyl-5-hydroxy-6-metoxy-1,4-benzoquinol methylase